MTGGLPPDDSRAGTARDHEDPPALAFHALDTDRWPDLETVLGARGGHDGCWCMRWRVPRLDFERRRGHGNRRGLREGITTGRVGGILGYRDEVPVAWCAVGPREEFPVLDTTDVLARVDTRPVWSIGCCFLVRKCRRVGYSKALIAAAVEYAAGHGAKTVEAYPVVARKGRIPLAAAWTGFASAYLEAGFVEVARRVDIRPIVRLELDSDPTRTGRERIESSSGTRSR